VKTILGLTATATLRTCNDICDHLQISADTAVRGEIFPTNLQLSVSKDINKDEALLALLRSPRFAECDSIIIYCTRRDDCMRVATIIRIRLQVSMKTPS